MFENFRTQMLTIEGLVRGDIYVEYIYISYFNFLFMEFSRVFIIIPKYLGSSGNNLPNN